MFSRLNQGISRDSSYRKQWVTQWSVSIRGIMVRWCDCEETRCGMGPWRFPFPLASYLENWLNAVPENIASLPFLAIALRILCCRNQANLWLMSRLRCSFVPEAPLSDVRSRQIAKPTSVTEWLRPPWPFQFWFRNTFDSTDTDTVSSLANIHGCSCWSNLVSICLLARWCLPATSWQILRRGISQLVPVRIFPFFQHFRARFSPSVSTFYFDLSTIEVNSEICRLPTRVYNSLQ